MHTETTDVLDLMVKNRLWQPELRNPISQHASECVQRLEYSDLMAQQSKVGGCGQPSRTRPYDRHLGSVWAKDWLDSLTCSSNCPLPAVVRGETFECANRYWLASLRTNALGLTLVLLRTDSAAYGWETVSLLDLLERLLESALPYQGNKGGYVNRYWTTRYTWLIPTIQATRGLCLSLILAVPQGHFIEVAPARQRAALASSLGMM